MSAADRPYVNDASRLEKAEIHANERKLRQGERQGTTYHAQAMAGLDEPPPGGRFAQARYVTGSEPSTQYPAASSPWTAGNDAGLEPPLNQDVNFVEPAGEAHEIEKALSELAQEGQGCKPISAGEDNAAPFGRAVAPTEVAPFAKVVETGAAIPPDGLGDCPRRADGTPLSTSVNFMKRRKLA
jgi:hypothetical protein